MSCEAFLECLHERLDGPTHPMELAQSLPEWARRHLDECPACRDAVHELVALEGSLSVLQEMPPMPGGLTEGILARIREPAAAPLPADPRPRWWGLAAAVVLAVLAWSATLVPADLAPPAFAWLELGWSSLTASWQLSPLTLPAVPPVPDAMAWLAAALLGAATLLSWRWSAAT